MAGCEEYATARKKEKKMVLIEEKKNGLWKYVIHKTNEAFDGGIKQIWVRDKKDTGPTSRRGRHGSSYDKSTER